MDYKIIALVIMALVFVYETVIYYFDTKSAKLKIPDNVADIYNEEEYKKWLAYDAECNKFGLIRHVFSSLLGFLLIGFDAYAGIVKLVGAENIYIAAITVIIANTVIDELFSIPFAYYRDMVIEQKYGFNRKTVKTFVIDEIKSLAISLALMCAVICVLAWMHQTIGNALIIAFSVVMIGFTLVINLLSPIFTRIFNKLTPLEEGDLRTRLLDLLESNGCKVHDIYITDGSRRSTRANAYFGGLGKLKTIVLYDTLMEQMTEDEILAVFAHEMGHNKHKDTLKLLGVAMLNIILMVFILWGLVSVPEIYSYFGFDSVNYGFAFILLSTVCLSALSPIISLLQAAQSRRCEYGADGFAADKGYGPALISALKKLAKNNFACLSPHPVVVALSYDHPTISQRIEFIKNKIKE